MIDFIHHIFFSFNFSEFMNTINFSSFLSPTSFSWETIFAFDLSWASDTIIMAEGLIWRTSFICNVVVMNPFISVFSISTMAAIIGGFTWNEYLRRDNNIWPYSFSLDFNPITQSWSSRESPTWSAIDRNMLIPLISKIVNSTNIPPEKVTW